MLCNNTDCQENWFFKSLITLCIYSTKYLWYIAMSCHSFPWHQHCKGRATCCLHIIDHICFVFRLVHHLFTYLKQIHLQTVSMIKTKNVTKNLLHKTPHSNSTESYSSPSKENIFLTTLSRHKTTCTFIKSQSGILTFVNKKAEFIFHEIYMEFDCLNFFWMLLTIIFQLVFS